MSSTCSSPVGGLSIRLFVGIVDSIQTGLYAGLNEYVRQE